MLRSKRNRKTKDEPETQEIRNTGEVKSRRNSIFCDFAGRGYTDDEEIKYNLIFNFKLDERSQDKSIEKAIELLKDPQLKIKGKNKQKKLLNRKMERFLL